MPNDLYIMHIVAASFVWPAYAFSDSAMYFQSTSSLRRHESVADAQGRLNRVESLSGVPTKTFEQVAASRNATDDVKHILLFDGSMQGSLSTLVETYGGKVERSHKLGVAVVSGLSEYGVECIKGKAADWISAVAVDETFRFDEPTADAQVVEEAKFALHTTSSPSDPTAAFFYNSYQWNMRAISADAAWARGRLGSPSVTVAVLDTGIDYEHYDLAGRVDLGRSASFVPFDDLLVSIYFPGKHPIVDLHFHGTHVASTAVSNAFGAAGVTSRATLMGVKVCSVLGWCPFSAIIFGILHAVDNGADVINLSLGSAFLKAGSGNLVAYINKVFNYVRSRGVTTVVAAGNGARDLDHSPNLYRAYCDTPASTCVAATAPNSTGSLSGPWANVDLPAQYTNFGNSAIDVAAPGGGGNGLILAACSHFSLIIAICRTSIFFYLYASGTSMSSAHVAGLAALIVEDVGRNPGLVKARIGNGADDVGKQGVDAYSGKGRINVDATAD